MAGRKAPNADIEQRIDKVFEMLVSGASTRQICRYVSEKTDWSISRRQLERYVAEAEKQLIEASKTEREKELGRAIARLHKIFFCCMQIQDYKAALAVQREINSLLNLTLAVHQDQSKNEADEDIAYIIKQTLRQYAEDYHTRNEPTREEAFGEAEQ